MIEFAVVVIAALLIIGVVIEVFEILERRDVEAYERRSRGRLLDELRRQR